MFLAKGDVVTLRSGGPDMTIGEIKGQTVSCLWFEGARQQRAEFDSELLVRCKSLVTASEELDFAEVDNFG